MGTRKRTNKKIPKSTQKRVSKKRLNNTRKMRGGTKIGMWLMLTAVVVALFFGEFSQIPAKPTEPITTLASMQPNATLADDVKPSQSSTVTLILSDLHGAREFVDTFTASGVMKVVDGKCAWNPTTTVTKVKATGDLVDRGQASREIVTCMTDFLESANFLNGKGTVFVGFGNHELLLLQHKFRYVHPFDALDDFKEAKLTSIAIHDAVIKGHITAANIDDGVIYSHAGFTYKFIQNMKNDPDFNKFADTEITDENVATLLVPYLNEKLKRDVAATKPGKPFRSSGPMYEAGPIRSDGKKPGGPFWADEQEHRRAVQPAFKDIIQITGHNTQEDKEMSFDNGVFFGDTGHHRDDKTALMMLTHTSDDGVKYVPRGIELQINTPDGLQTIQVLNFTKSEGTPKTKSAWSATSSPKLKK
jgi:hypothetical protein